MIARQCPFHLFDWSMNQTDRVLTEHNSQLVREALPGDKLVIKGYGSYILNLRVELLSEYEEHKPLWKYLCPQGHPLKLFYPEGHGYID